MILTSPTTMSDNTIDNPIHQLHVITTQQQNAINSIQATLAIQQSAIVDIKTSINHIIRSLSDISTKLGLEITLPPPLTLFRAPPTSPPVVAASSPTPPPPTSLHATAAGSMSAATPARKSPTPPPSFSNAMCSNNNVATIQSSFTPHSLPLLFPTPTTNNSNIITEATTASDFDFTSPQLSFIFSNHSAPFADAEHFVTDLMNNIFIPEKMELQETILTAVHNFKFDSNSVTVRATNKRQCESKIYIFDPGGTFEIESIFDLEDKVGFEGLAMIRTSLRVHKAQLQSHILAG